MGKYRPSGNLIVAGQAFATDAPIVNFHDCPWDATLEVCIATDVDPKPACQDGFPYGVPPGGLRSTKRHGIRPALRGYGNKPPLDAVRGVVRKILLHHDGVGSSELAFTVLHNERGLSMHFYIDNDGTIYQTCDVAMMALHAAELNPDSIGISLSNRGDAAREPTFYKSRGLDRQTRSCTINGHVIQAFDFAREQYASLSRLIAELLRVLPDIPPIFPTGPDGRQLWTTLPESKLASFAGILGNYHRTDRKWDPGPLDFAAVMDGLRGKPCFPIAVGKRPAPIHLESLEVVAQESQALYDNCARASGQFPVGPWGKTALWHGGVHITAPEGAPVVAPFPGTIVAARSSTTPVGSGSFVLLRHELPIGNSAARIFTLYMHLAGLDGGDKAPAWMKRDRIALRPGEVQLLKLQVEAGGELGRVGVAGPAGHASPQVHLEVISATEIGLGTSHSFEVFDGSATGRVCTFPPLTTLTPEAARHVVTYHLSEWSSEAKWAPALYGHPDVGDADVDRLIADQITPLLWWNEQVAVHCGLPSDGVVYHYHPIAFIQAYNEIELGHRFISDNATIVPSDACNAMITLDALVKGTRPECEPNAPAPDPNDGAGQTPPKSRPGLIDI